MTDTKAHSTRQSLTELLEQQRLPPDQISTAINIAELHPAPSKWHDFISPLLFWGGVAGLAFGLIFFIAANWQDMGRMSKFALLESVIFIAILGYMRFSEKERIRKGILLFSMLAVGALMAFFGQTFQTGADPWQLFFNWALLTTPWVLISRFNIAWLLWLGLLNLSLSLFLLTFREFQSFSYWMFLLNSVALGTWQIATRYYAWLDDSWSLNIVGVVNGYFALMVFFDGLFDNQLLGIALWVSWALVVFYVYRHLRLNIFMLSGWCLAGVIAINAIVIRIMPDDEPAILFLFMTILTVALGAYAANWLNNLIQGSKA